jgi:hypothetical protein
MNQRLVPAMHGFDPPGRSLGKEIAGRFRSFVLIGDDD